MSCERLRALLPWFDGRREDMASVLEMAVQFLQLAGTLVPGWEQQAVSRPVTAGSALCGGAMVYPCSLSPSVPWQLRPPGSLASLSPRPARPALLLPVNTPPFVYHTSSGSLGDELQSPLCPLPMVPKLASVKVHPPPRVGHQLQPPSSQSEGRGSVLRVALCDPRRGGQGPTTACLSCGFSS